MNAVLPPPAELRERAIVLVHGAWVGEWSWCPVLPRLQASGRPVYNVSLTGQGARRHQHGAHITLADHVADVVGVFDTFDLAEVTLVGHSYGGRVITGAAAQVASRLAAIVYLDAHAPIAPDLGQPAERHESAAANHGLLPFGGYEHDVELLGDDVARQWFLDRVVMHPFQTFTAPWQHPVPEGVRPTYVFATESPASRFGTYAGAAAAHPDWAYHELAGPHFLMFTHPDDVANIILGA
jgi:pimeloyl-ACP methyl ester carboxylesterase